MVCSGHFTMGPILLSGHILGHALHIRNQPDQADRALSR